LDQINLAPEGSGIKNAERSHHRKPLGFSGGDTGAVIH
jgi:hypothetical protein